MLQLCLVIPGTFHVANCSKPDEEHLYLKQSPSWPYSPLDIFTRWPCLPEIDMFKFYEP